MMQKTMVRVYGIAAGVLALIGLLAGESPLFGLFNAGLFLDVVRLIVAVVLIYIGFVADHGSLVRGALRGAGVLCLVIGILGLIDPPLWGLLSADMSVFDGVAHIVLGLLALAVASKKDSEASHDAEFRL